jgi:hypothetical protein
MDATQGTNKFPKCNSLHIMSKLDWLEKAKIGTADSRIREARKPQVGTIVHSQVTAVTFRRMRRFDKIPIT